VRSGDQRKTASARGPYLGGAGVLGRRRQDLEGSIERRLLVGRRQDLEDFTERRLLIRLPLQHREFQLISGRWGRGPVHGTAED
jgi:hypothetical protein